jgi:hypothetical protein
MHLRCFVHLVSAPYLLLAQQLGPFPPPPSATRAVAVLKTRLPESAALDDPCTEGACVEPDMSSGAPGTHSSKLSMLRITPQPNGPTCRDQWLRGAESLKQQRIDVAKTNFTWPSDRRGKWEQMVYARSGVRAIGRRPSGRRVLFIHIGKAGGTATLKFLRAASIPFDEVHCNAVLPEVALVRVRAYA